MSSGAIKTHRFLTLKNNHIENRSGLEARKEEVWGWPQGWGNHAGTKESGPAHPEVASASLGNLDPPSAFQSRLFSVTMVMKHEKKDLNCFPGRKGEKENKMLPFLKCMLVPRLPKIKQVGWGT